MSEQDGRGKHRFYQPFGWRIHSSELQVQLSAAFITADLTELHLKASRTAAASAQLRLAQMQREVEKHLGGGGGDAPPVWMTSAGVFSTFTPSLLVLSLLNNQFSALFFLTGVFCGHATSRPVLAGRVYGFSVL